MIEQISSRLREERKRLGFANQAQLAAQLGISPSSVHNYESGKRSPDAEFLAAFAQLGADVLYIIQGQPSSSDLAPDERALLAAYRAMDARGKGAVLGMVTGYTQPLAPSLTISGATIGQVVQGDATGGGSVNVKPESKDSKKRR